MCIYLFNSIDSWIYYTKYYDSLFKIIESKDKYLNCNGNNDCLPLFDSSIEEALLFLNELQKLNSEQNYPQRGVYLARLELYSRLKENAYKYMGKIIHLNCNLINKIKNINYSFLATSIFFQLYTFLSIFRIVIGLFLNYYFIILHVLVISFFLTVFYAQIILYIINNNSR